MIDLLKKAATQKLGEMMLKNALSPKATDAAAEAGSSALIAGLMDTLKGGDISKITQLFSNEGPSTNDNPITGNLIGKLTDVLKGQGMNDTEAAAEASNVAPGLINSLKDRFMSQDEADAGFDIANVASLLGGGDKGGLLNKVTGLFK